MVNLIKFPSSLPFEHLACSECEGTQFYIQVDITQSHVRAIQLTALVCANCEAQLRIKGTTSRKESSNG